MSSENARAHVRAELARGDEALRAAHELLKIGLLNDAVSRAYYAALHRARAAARALLLTEGVEPQTHAGVSSMLGMHFVMPGRLNAEHAKELARLEQFRAEADYNRFFVFTMDGAAEEVAAADRFCAAGRAIVGYGRSLENYARPKGHGRSSVHPRATRYRRYDRRLARGWKDRRGHFDGVSLLGARRHQGRLVVCSVAN